VAVAVLIVNGGVGGDVAAPIARQVLEAALAG
jgi:cell division protein FtsI/penicillin-binding protein 2